MLALPKIFKFISCDRDQVMGRIPIEKLVKMKEPEDEEKVLVTVGKGISEMSWSCKDSIEMISVYSSCAKTLTRELSKVFWNTTVTMWQKVSSAHLRVSDMIGDQASAGNTPKMIRCRGNGWGWISSLPKDWSWSVIWGCQGQIQLVGYNLKGSTSQIVCEPIVCKLNSNNWWAQSKVGGYTFCLGVLAKSYESSTLNHCSLPKQGVLGSNPTGGIQFAWGYWSNHIWAQNPSWWAQTNPSWGIQFTGECLSNCMWAQT